MNMILILEKKTDCVVVVSTYGRPQFDSKTERSLCCFWSNNSASNCNKGCP